MGRIAIELKFLMPRKKIAHDLLSLIRCDTAHRIYEDATRTYDLVGIETLATSLRPGLAGRGHRWSGDLNGVAAELELEKI